MTAVFVVRHPQTTWNVAERYQGRLEAPLTNRGRAEGKIVARTFAGQYVDAVYSSPLSRALDLAAEISHAADGQLRVDQRLTEMGLGPWEGLYRSEIEGRYPNLYREWYQRPDEVTFPNGESLRDVHIRSQSALSDILTAHPEGNVIVVSHSAVIQVLASTALRIPLRDIHRIRVTNCSITTLCGLQAPGSVLSLNATEHLYHSPLSAAAAHDCVSWVERRMTL